VAVAQVAGQAYFSKWPQQVSPQEAGNQVAEHFMDYGKSWADRLSENPKPDGLNAETRYWIDDMYLLTTLKLEAYRRRGTRSVWTATRRTATIC
jgi:hypothetical protein